jgi:integration host factor subunit alpha
MQNSNTLIKAELTHVLMKELKLSKSEAAEFVVLFYEEMVLAFIQGESVHLSGLGNFDLRDKKARLGRNPRTKEPCSITPRRVVTFHAGRKLRAELKQKDGGISDVQ